MVGLHDIPPVPVSKTYIDRVPGLSYLASPKKEFATIERLDRETNQLLPEIGKTETENAVRYRDSDNAGRIFARVDNPAVDIVESKLYSEVLVTPIANTAADSFQGRNSVSTAPSAGHTEGFGTFYIAPKLATDTDGAVGNSLFMDGLLAANGGAQNVITTRYGPAEIADAFSVSIAPPDVHETTYGTVTLENSAHIITGEPKGWYGADNMLDYSARMEVANSEGFALENPVPVFEAQLLAYLDGIDILFDRSAQHFIYIMDDAAATQNGGNRAVYRLAVHSEDNDSAYAATEHEEGEENDEAHVSDVDAEEEDLEKRGSRAAKKSKRRSYLKVKAAASEPVFQKPLQKTFVAGRVPEAAVGWEKGAFRLETVAV